MGADLYEIGTDMSSDLAIRPAVVQECALLASLHKACFAKSWTEKQIIPMLAMPGAFVLIAERLGVPEGFIMVRAGGGEAEILTICVLPKSRGHRLGENLITASIAHLMAHGAPQRQPPDLAFVPPLFLEVAQSNHAARSLYARMGFEVVGKRPNYYRHEDGSQETALMMRLGAC